MRITGPNGLTASPPAQGARRKSAGTFTLPEVEGRPAPAQTGAVRGIAGIEALLALQGVDDPLVRRKRAVARGRTALDALDELKLGLLAGALSEGTLERLKAAAASLKETSGDPGLDHVLAEIELRVEVELAKIGAGRCA